MNIHIGYASPHNEPTAYIAICTHTTGTQHDDFKDTAAQDISTDISWADTDTGRQTNDSMSTQHEDETHGEQAEKDFFTTAHTTSCQNNLPGSPNHLGSVEWL